MSTTLFLVTVVIITALFFDFTNGFHDSANAMATSVATGALKPKVAVLMIGTNNSNGNEYSAEQIGDGIVAIVQKLRAKLPETKILILAVFPRGENPNSQREKNAAASARGAKLADNKHVFFLDIGEKFLDEKGHLAKEIMPDYLHLSPKGYQIWAESIEPKLAELLGDKPVAGHE